MEQASLGARVARYLELRALERALQGDLQGDLVGDLELEQLLEVVTRPSPETSLFQKPLFEDEQVPVAHGSPPEGDELTEEHLVVLGFVTGVLSVAGKLEVVVFPGARASVAV